MRSWFAPPRRAVEATPAQIVATGAAAGGTWGGDGIDTERGWKPVGGGTREVPYWTQERARTFSVASYRSNPMCRAVVDTYTSFCVGDKGVSLQVTNPQVREVAEEFWEDPRNNMTGGQELGLRSNLLLGENLRELMVGPISGVVRWVPLDPIAVQEVLLHHGNPNWPRAILFGTDQRELAVAGINDLTRLREGQVFFWTPWKTTETDVRSMPYLTSVLDWFGSYDTIISNLIDRTALARYLVWDVTVEGTQTDVDAYVQGRGGLHVPRSGSVEVHNQSVTWKPQHTETGAYEDSNAAKSVLTLIAGGSGLAKTWLAEPEDANRATSLTMAEPVRRRVGGVQKVWLGFQTEQVRYAVDRAVAAKRLPATVQAADPKTGETYQIAAARTVTVTGPEVAAADAQITAQVLLNLATGLEKFVTEGLMTREGAAVAARKGWEDYVGVPWRSDLGTPTGKPAERDDIATHLDDPKVKLRAV